MIGIINYGGGNVFAIANLYKRADIPFLLSDKIVELKKADKLILPGVGSFDETMCLLNKSGLPDFLNEQVQVLRKPILGVCVGMQILGESSEEGNENGFGWIKGKIRKLDANKLHKKPHLPHLGWNSITLKKPSELLKDIDTDRGFYFLHSYYFQCTDENDIVAVTNYGEEFACCINKGNVFGVQFHPEKSHFNGIQLFNNFNNL